MKKTTMRLFALALLTMVSMGAWAKIEVEIANNGKFTGGTITEVKQSESGGKVTVTIGVTPDKNKGYTIKKDDIHVYATYPLSGSRPETRTPNIAGTLTLYYDGDKDKDTKDLSSYREYTFIVESGLNAWVKEATFTPNGRKNGYSGTYYIGSRDYDASKTTNNFYLCPTEGWAFYVATNNVQGTDNGQPFLTTYKCRDGVYDVRKAVWTIEKAPAPNDAYYYIKQALTGKYVVSNGVLTGAGNTRARVHLETVANAEALATLGDWALFEINDDNGHYDILPHSNYGRDGNNKYLVVNTNNYNQLDGNSIKTNGPTGFINCGGIIGLYTYPDGGNAYFYLETATPVTPAPTITNNYDGTITITGTGTIYYTTDGTEPTTSSSTYSTAISLTDDITVIRAMAKNGTDYESMVVTEELPKCEKPVITISNGIVTITTSTEGASIRYTDDDTQPTSSSTPYNGAFSLSNISVIRAIAVKSGWVNSDEAYYMDFKTVSSSTEMTNMHGLYRLASDFTSTAAIGTSSEPFSGVIDGQMNTISGLSHPLVAYAEGATIKNVILDNVSINDGTNVGAICGEAKGDTRIYNCGVLATNSTAVTDDKGYTSISYCSSSVTGSGYVGGIVGLLDGSSRVINCFSYANVNGGSEAGGIVGHNNVATTATNLKTMVMNCMFYGEVSGTSIAPIYNGQIITNVGENTGVSNFNYFRLEAAYIENTNITKVYNCALGAETRFLQRFEFFRHLLNSHLELAAWWATGSMVKDKMMKWVLEPSQIGSSTPYPILKSPGKYPSVVNYDAENAPLASERNKGGHMGTLSVTISGTGGGAVFSAPNGASITTSSLTLNITDKDPDHFNFNYYKVQLPYYNDVGSGNYTGNRVVTGWKIVGITGGTPGEFKKEDSDKGYNFADRNCTNKDLYSVSGRIFNQGAYWDVPKGVTGITIQPYWAKCVYLADPNADKVYDQGMTTGYNVPNVGGGQIYTNGTSYSIAGENQVVYTTMSNAISSSALFSGGDANKHSVYDYAVVLVGNYHHYGALEASNSKPYTVTSIDLDGDNEPDYSYILRFDGRTAAHPTRVDFINIPGLGMAQKSTGGTGSYNLGIMQPKNWFESTNTSLFRVTQFEYDNSNRVAAPYIVQGGVMEQWVSGQNNGVANNTTYYHVGGNVWFKEFHRGTHQDKSMQSKHPPVSVTGGDYDEFYLTGLYTANVASYADNAECYINGGCFGTVAGAAMEGLGKAGGADNTGNITWQVQNADIKEFFAGGINADKPVTGNLSTTITGGKIDLFCGGPKFGDMSTGKTVTTNATDCVFGTFFGAGYGGNSYSRQAPRNHNSVINFPHNDKDAGNHDSWNAWLAAYYTQSYNSTYGGVSTQFSYQFLPMSDNKTNVARIFVDYVKFSLATCRNVTSTLTGCKITGNFYGGGSLGSVKGDVTSTLTNCEVSGSVFGAGFSASLPPVEVDQIGFETEPFYYTDLGTYRSGVKGSTTTYKWQKKTGNSLVDNTNHILYTTEDLTTLGTVTGKATLNIEGTTIAKSVYGGGEESGVGDGTEGDGTEVIITSGTIGTQGQGGVEYGNVYGGGKGKVGDKVAGYVKGNTTVNISQAKNMITTIYHNVYGGGAYGSVGDFNYDVTSGIPTSLKTENTGATNVTITGGTIGSDGHENGMVFGSSRGDVAVPEGEPAVDPNDRMAWVYSTHVTIGDTSAETSPSIKGSVYGSGENGHTFQNTIVDIKKGVIGITDTSIDGGAAYPYRGNVYGGGCGTDMYDSDGDEILDAYNPLAGFVRGSATVNITGGQIAHNVYGAGAMGSVGSASVDNSGKTTINISGGRIGYDGDRNGHVFGAARGEFGVSTAASDLANVRETEVNIKYTSTPTTSTPTADNEGKTEQLIAGSVFGGGEAGTVKGSVAVNMTGGLILKDIYGGGALADTQTSNWNANANSGAGNWATGKTSASATTTVRLTGGTILGEAYGGGLGEAGKPAYVYGDVLLDLNGTTSSGEESTAIAEDARGCAVNQVFGCNNVNGTPMGNVMVHIYATQNKAKSQIANTNGDTPVTDAKVKGSYDVAAVYGGGNLAAYEPAGGKNTTNSTNVIIDGCGLTSIQTVYGGGNAACTPATNVTVNGTFEILELFGGGNGLDDIQINGVDMPNPGANVGYKNYSEYYYENDTWKVKDKDDADTKEERIASEYVYGTGKASVNIFGGTVHRVFGGSNTKGNVRQTAVTLLDENNSCAFCVDEAYGGGKNAPMDAEAKLLMSCIPGLSAAYGGAEAAAIQGNVTLNITNGTFDRVFGGNNLSGTISGSITVNIEEIGCKPIKIGELYGGGNQAGYSVYGYDSDGKPKESGTRLYDDPQVNVKSFTSIGNIFGGGYGEGATMVGNPTVNVNEVYGRWYDNTSDNTSSIVGENAKTSGNYPIPSHAVGKMGAINNVFGGGNAAKVIGNTTVNIGTLEDVYVVNTVTVGASVTGYYTRNNDGTYSEATGVAVEGTTYYEKNDVLGADIRGNVYGGGNNAEVTGNTKVVIGKSSE